MNEYKYEDEVKRVLFEEYRVVNDPKILNSAFNMRDELNEVYRKAEAFDEIDGYLIEAYENFHNMKDVDKRNRLIQYFIARKVTLLFKELGDKYGYKESGESE